MVGEEGQLEVESTFISDFDLVGEEGPSRNFFRALDLVGEECPAAECTMVGEEGQLEVESTFIRDFDLIGEEGPSGNFFRALDLVGEEGRGSEVERIFRDLLGEEGASESISRDLDFLPSKAGSGWSAMFIPVMMSLLFSFGCCWVLVLAVCGCRIFERIHPLSFSRPRVAFS
jgi:hypothetical protein